MKKFNFLFTSTALALLAALPFAVSPHNAHAHGHNEFKIGNKTYHILIGSLNEPVSVDDKTGVDLRIEEGVESGGHHMAGMAGDHEELTKPVIGLEKDIKVELIAGDQKKVIDFSPAFNDPGAYRAYFIPTVRTTYTYRVFGKINGVEVSLPFICNPTGHVQTDAEMKPIEISPGVIQTEKTGAFGCPASRGDSMFPAPKITFASLDRQVQDSNAAAASSGSRAMIGIALGALGLVAGVSAWMRKRKQI